VVRAGQGRHVGIEIDYQNVILVVATVIVTGAGGHEAGTPGVKVSPGSVDTQVRLAPDTHHDLMVFMAMLV
jgi:hypothetical protein